MSLPLPPSDWPAVRLGLSPGVMAYTAKQMREYGQQCREAALGDIVTLATAGAGYTEIMDYLQSELLK